MGNPAASSRGPRGEIETLPSGSLRVRVYAGVDPVSGRRLHLTETIPAGPDGVSPFHRAIVELTQETTERLRIDRKVTYEDIELDARR